MNFDEITNIFDIDKNLMEKIDEFKDERISKAISSAGEKYSVIFHAIPLNAFSKLPISLYKMNDELRKHSFFTGLYSYNFEGLYNNAVEDEFYQIFRNGIIEVRLEEYGPEHRISVSYYRNKFVKFVNETLKIYNALEIDCPLLFYVTVVNIKGCILDKRPGVRSDVMDLERNMLDPIGSIIGQDSNVENEVGKLFVPIWNHFGVSEDYINYRDE